MDVNYLIERWKKVRHYVKVMPFVLNFFYILSIIPYNWDNDIFIKVVDLIFYNSPIMCLVTLGLSFKVGLCKWHKTACLIPMLYFVVVVLYLCFPFINHYKNDTAILITTSAILSLIAGLNVFYNQKLLIFIIFRRVNIWVRNAYSRIV